MTFTTDRPFATVTVFVATPGLREAIADAS
jgi:hypothetical protein